MPYVLREHRCFCFSKTGPLLPLRIASSPRLDHIFKIKLLSASEQTRVKLIKANQDSPCRCRQQSGQVPASPTVSKQPIYMSIGALTHFITHAPVVPTELPRNYYSRSSQNVVVSCDTYRWPKWFACSTGRSVIKHIYFLPRTIYTAVRMLWGWIHFMMTSSNGKFSALLTLCKGNSPVSG